MKLGTVRYERTTAVVVESGDGDAVLLPEYREVDALLQVPVEQLRAEVESALACPGHKGIRLAATRRPAGQGAMCGLEQQC